MEIDFLKKVLMSTAEYWIVAKIVTAREFCKNVRKADQIIFICIPKEIKTGIAYEDITLKAIENLYNTYIEQNIYINANYPPFQSCLLFSDLYEGYPVECKIKEFMLKALELKSNQIFNYKDLITAK